LLRGALASIQAAAAQKLGAAVIQSPILRSKLESRTPHEDVRVWRCGALPNVELTVAVNCTRRWRVFHESYAICVVPHSTTINTAAWHYRRHDLLIHNGMLGLMEPGETHINTRDPIGGNFWVAHLSADLLTKAATELSLRTATPHFRALITLAPHLLAEFCRLYDAFRTGASVLEQQSRLAGCIRMLFEDCCERAPGVAVRPGRARLDRAREYLHEHYQEGVSLAELAGVSGMSAYHLVREFRAMYGLPPHAYQNQLRVAAVARQLRAGVPLRDLESGFYDQTHLTRHFKRAFGVTPGRYALAEPPSLPRFQ
jgi:AraC-like DNA-binding protein